jgi:ligand-binding sensor domain-containing protein
VQGLDESMGNEFFDVYQDKKGYMWFASNKGVLRYDGYSFRNFNSSDSLVDNTIFSIYEDHTGRLWFYGMRGELSYFENEKMHPFKGNEQIKKLLKGPRIAKSMLVEKDNSIWISYINGGLINFSKGNVSAQEQKDTTLEYSFYVKDINGDLLSFSSDKTWKFKRKDSLKIIYENKKGRATITSPNSKGGLNNIAVFKRRNGTVCISSKRNFIEIFADGTNKVQRLNFDVNRIYEDPDSLLWVATRSNGLIVFEKNETLDLSKGRVVFRKEQFTGICADKEGGLWLTSLDHGILYIPNIRILKGDLMEDNEPVAVRALARVDKDKLLVGFKNCEVQSFSNNGFDHFYRYKIENELSNLNAVFYEKQSKRTIVCGTGYFLVFENNKLKKQLRSSNILSVTKGVKNNVYVFGCNSGVVSYNDEESMLYKYRSRLRTGKVFNFRGQIYAGSINGLYTLDSSYDYTRCGGKLFEDVQITDMDTLPGGDLIVATNGKGIFIGYDTKWEQYSKKNGLSTDLVTAITVDEKGVLWLAGNNSIDQMIYENGKPKINPFIPLNSFLSIGEINDIDVCNDVVTLATGQGIVWFNIKDLKKNLLPPPVYIRSVTANEDNYDLTRTNVAQWTDEKDFIRIDFTGLSYCNPGKLQYQYRLVGLDDKYRRTTSTFVQFTSLNPGKYKFEVLAANNDGVWSPRPAVFEFVILPPFWMTTWFRILTIVIIISLVFTIANFRIRKIREKLKIREQLLTYRQQALAAQVNPHFVFNSLNSIQSFIMTDDKRAASRYLSEFSTLMRRILDHSQKEYVKLSDEIKLIESYVLMEQLRFDHKFSFECNLGKGINPDNILVPSMLTQTFIENAILHGINHSKEKDLYVRVTFMFREEILACEIEDNGVGLSYSKQLNEKVNGSHRSSGVDLIRERLKLSCENLSIPFAFEIKDRNPGNGTIVSFNIPYIKRNI